MWAFPRFCLHWHSSVPSSHLPHNLSHQIFPWSPPHLNPAQPILTTSRWFFSCTNLRPTLLALEQDPPFKAQPQSASPYTTWSPPDPSHHPPPTTHHHIPSCPGLCFAASPTSQHYPCFLPFSHPHPVLTELYLFFSFQFRYGLLREASLNCHAGCDVPALGFHTLMTRESWSIILFCFIFSLPQ